jgi:hypothetical protein
MVGIAAPALAKDPFSGVNCSGSAASSTLCAGKSSTSNPLTGTNGLIHKATLIIALVTGSVAVIIIILGGFMYITSGGDPQKVSTAKNTILYAAIGLVVIVAAQTIITFVLSKL